jgi:cytochrome P450
MLECPILTVSREAAVQTTIPLHSPDFFTGDPYPAYKELRATAPVCWNDVTKFWALLRYEDIRYG